MLLGESADHKVLKSIRLLCLLMTVNVALRVNRR
jgi:hypothetical protein